MPEKIYARWLRQSLWQWPVDGVSIIVFAGMLGFMIAYSWLALNRHATFNSTGFDLAIQEQSLWNALQGRFFVRSMEVDHMFADHFRPFLYAFLPIYLLIPRTETLLIVQVIGLASGAVPLFLLAREKLENPRLSAVLALSYLLYPALGFIARFDFHLEAFIIPAFLWAFYKLEQGKMVQASFWLLIPLLSKESFGIEVAFLGLFAVIGRRRWRWGIAWAIVGFLAFIGTTFWLIPIYRGEGPDSLERYAWLGHSVREIAVAGWQNPGQIVSWLLDTTRLTYYRQLLVPVAFLSLLGLPELLPLVPALLINALADHFCMPTIYCHYTGPLIPFIFIGLVFGLGRIKKWAHERPAILPVVTGIVFLAGIGSLWADNAFRPHSFLPSATEPPANIAVVEQAVEVVPDSGSLVTTNDYAPHFSQREKLFVIGQPAQRAAPTDPQVVFINLYDQQFILCDEIRRYVTSLDPQKYGTLFRTGGVIVAVRDGGDEAQFRDFVENWNNCAG